jgi:hypothetical protein
MIRERLLVAVVVSLIGGADAQAEMYRYRDPETGQMKLTNIPPPWMASGRGPQVELIQYPPASAASPAAPPAPAAPASTASPAAPRAPATPGGTSVATAGGGGAGTLSVSAPGAPWELRFPRDQWSLQTKRRADGQADYYMFSNARTQLNMSFFIEPVTKCKTPSECRSHFWRNRGAEFGNPQSVAEFEENGFAVVRFLIPEIGGMRVDQLQYSAHTVRDGYWVDMRISKILAQKADEQRVSDFVRSVAFAQKSDAGKTAGSYPLPEHGVFRMTVPQGWRDELRQPPKALPPTIVFRPASGPPFEVLVTPIWRARADAPLPTKGELQQRVEGAIEGVRSQVVEKNIRLVEFQGASGAGVYFSVTDRAPKRDEYKYMTQGMLGVRELTVTFTILTNDGQEAVVRDALAMLRSAVHDER